MSGSDKNHVGIKNLELAGSYHQEPMSYPALLSWCEKQASLFAPYICDTGSFLGNALASHKRWFWKPSLEPCVISIMVFSLTLQVPPPFPPMVRLEPVSRVNPRPCCGCPKSIFHLCGSRTFRSRKSNVQRLVQHPS